MARGAGSSLISQKMALNGAKWRRNGAGMALKWRGIFAALPARISGKPDIDNIGGMNMRISKR